MSSRSMKRSCFVSDKATGNDLAKACKRYGMSSNLGSWRRYKNRMVKKVMVKTGLLRSFQRFGYGFTSPTLEKSSIPLVLEGRVCVGDMCDQPKLEHGLFCRLHSQKLIWPKEVDGVGGFTAGISQPASVQEYIKMFEASTPKLIPLLGKRFHKEIATTAAGRGPTTLTEHTQRSNGCVSVD
ncbi:hypothetical protein Bca4012_078327 [Brassica carinata]